MKKETLQRIASQSNTDISFWNADKFNEVSGSIDQNRTYVIVTFAHCNKYRGYTYHQGKKMVMVSVACIESMGEDVADYITEGFEPFWKINK